MCPRQNETSGEDLYLIEFFDVWADAYVSEPNTALPGLAQYLHCSHYLEYLYSAEESN